MKEDTKVELGCMLMLCAIAGLIGARVYIPEYKDKKHEEKIKQISAAYKEGGVLIGKHSSPEKYTPGAWHERTFLLDTDGNTNTPEIAITQKKSEDGVAHALYENASVGQRDSIENWAKRLRGSDRTEVIVLNQKTR